MDFAYLCKLHNKQFETVKHFEGHAQKHHAEGFIPKVICLKCRRDYDGMNGFRGERKREREKERKRERERERERERQTHVYAS